MATDTTITTPPHDVAGTISNSTFAFTLFLVVALIALWGISFLTFGVPGLYIPAVAFVPVMFVILLIITRG